MGRVPAAVGPASGGARPAAATGYSQLLLIAAGVILLGLIVYLVFRKHIYGTK